MWRMTPRLATATLTAMLAIAPATAPEARAASVQTYAYNTSGSISGPSNAPITFQPESSTTTLATPGSVVLGQFITNPLPTTASLAYNDTPFSVTLNVGGFNSTSPQTGPVNDTLYTISGVLNGTVSGDGTSSMMATATSISTTGAYSTPPFPISDLVISSQGIVAPNGSTAGVTTLTARVTAAGSPIPGLPAPAPEPSTIAILGLALAGWAGCRRSRPQG